MGVGLKLIPHLTQSKSSIEMTVNFSIVFGWDLDGMKHPDTISEDKYSLGADVLGPAGLLQMLEFKLGLGHPPVSRAVRIAQYYARLKAIDDGNFFYSDSFATDAWATASFLLSKRDQLIASGWKADHPNFWSKRLRIFENIENLDTGAIAPGLSDRLVELLNELQKCKILNIVPTVRLTTQLRFLPSIYKRILKTLVNRHGVSLEDVKTRPLCQEGDLKRLQNSFGQRLRNDLEGDGSFVVIESENEVQAAEYTAAWLYADMVQNSELVIIRGIGTSILDESCHRLRLPRVGGERISKFRGALQLLPLTFEILWKPFNPVRLIEFLSLPDCPVPRKMSYYLIEAIRIEPGIGGPAWKQAWALAMENFRNFLINQNIDTTKIVDIINEELKECKRWLDVARFDPFVGIPANEVIAICRRLAKWESIKAEKNDDNLLRVAAAQADAIARSIAECSLPLLAKVQLERIIDDAFSDGVSISGGGAEAAAWAVVDKPGQIWSRAKKVLWWGFVGGEERGAKQFWTANEIDELSESNIHMDPVGLDKLRNFDSSMRALQNTCTQLLLIKPLTMSGRPAHPHPFWPQLQVWLKQSSPEVRKKIVLNSGDFLSNKHEAESAGRKLQLNCIELKEPIVPKRNWSTLPGAIKAPKQESFTSMDLLLRCPFAWTVSYAAKIRPGILLDVPGDERLVGNLAHEIVAMLFREKSKWSDEQAKARTIELFDSLAPAIAAPLLLPGKLLELKRVKQAISKGICALVKLLNYARMEVIGCEVQKSAPFFDSIFIGSLDLVCLNTEGHTAIIDLKWARSLIHRKSELEEGKCLQLAAYSWLVSQNQSEYPSAGYFMLRQAQLLHSAELPFPPETCVQGSELSSIWISALEAYGSILNSLKFGRILAAGVDQDFRNGEEQNSSSMFKLEPLCKFCTFSNLCGKNAEPGH